MNARAGLIYRYGQAIDDPTMAGFGSCLLSRYQAGETAPSGSLAPVLEDLFALQGWEAVPPSEPFIEDYYFTDLQIEIGREHAGNNKGIYFAAKGGSTGEQHKHNDAGRTREHREGKEC